MRIYSYVHIYLYDDSVQVLIEIPDGKAKKVSGEARDAAWQAVYIYIYIYI